ncbi:MAG TPA: beta-propeller fold lactonase family protein, partial [Actinotalea sp.]|nr:beta-propeller fold lactonase family protein [Actinotalea sp.]
VHSTVLLPTDDGEVLLALDLGTDELRRFRVGDGGLLAADGLAGRLPHGSGPRHAAVTAAGHLLVVAELSAELYLLSWDRASATVSPLDRVQVAAPPALPSHVTVHGPGAAGPDELALVGVRATDRTDGGGPDGLAAVAVRGDRLDLRGRIGTGAWPRHHSQVGDLVWVAGQEAHEVQARRLDGGVGPAALSIPSPACVLPRP